MVLQAWKGENYLEDARVQAQYVKQLLDAHESSRRVNSVICPEKFSVKGKIVLLTGGAGFLGTQYGEALAEAGASVVIFDKQNEEMIQKTTKRFLCSEGALHSGFSVDITNERAVRVAVDTVMNRYGKIDCLINNAAMNPAVGSPEAAVQFNPYDSYDVGLWRKELETNLTGMQIVTQAVASIMMRQKRGSVINISSELSLIAYDHRIYGEGSGKYKSPAYITTKTGIVGLTRAWAEYLGRYNVRVNAFSPGGMQTDKHPKEFVSAYAYHNILGRMAHVGEYNGVIIFLCSDASSFMTGHNLVADGGKSAW